MPALSAILAIRAPSAAPGLSYRAYEEKWEGNRSLLDWIVARFRAGAPAGARIVCVSDSLMEKDRLNAACGDLEDAEILYADLRGERHLCRLLMERFGVNRVIVAGFSHATAPVDMIRHVVHVHAALNAELSDVAHARFRESFCVVESTLISEMEDILLPHVPQSILAAAEVLRAARGRDVRLARDFLWARIDVAKRFGLTAAQWPEQIAIRRPSDVAILRQAWSTASTAGGGDSGLVRAWKQAAISHLQPPAGREHSVEVKDSKSRVRVLYASHLPGFTGAHQSACHLIGALDRRRYDPIVVTSYSGTFTRELKQRNVSVICPERDITAAGLASFRYASDVLAEQRPHIVHAQHAVGMGFVCAAAGAGIPFVQHVRVPNVSTLRHYVHAADAVIAVSSFIREQLAELDIDLGKVAVVFNGVDQETFRPNPGERAPARRRLAIPHDEFVVLIVARMSPKKRHDVVIKAVADLRRTIGKGHLVMVGSRDYDYEYPSRIRALIRDEGLEAHTTAIEFTADIRAVLHACDVFALLSEDEPLSRAVLEAMTMGLPPIVGDSGGSKEVIQHGHNGMIIPSGDSTSLARTLGVLATDDTLRRKMGEAAVHTVTSSLTASHCAAKTTLVYERLLRGEHQGEQPASAPTHSATRLG